MKRYLLIALAVACMLLTLPNAAYALDVQPSTLTVIMKHGDITLRGYDIAVCLAAGAKEDNGSVVYTAAEAFAGAGADFTDLTEEKNIALAATLDAYAVARNIPRASKVTDNDGKAVFKGLSAGLYLVSQVEDEDSKYVIAPYLVMVPSLNVKLQGWNHNVIAYPKSEPVKRDVKTNTVSVYKVWAGVDCPPDVSILVQLYRGGVPYGNCVTLDARNNWSYTWEGLDQEGPWTVDEFDVAEGFAKTIAGSASTGFVITNTRRSPGAPEKTLVSGSKTWEHGSNSIGKWPKFIVLRLSANGVFILQKEVGEVEYWSWSIRMDKYDKDGKEIVYTVDEAPVEHYSKTVSGFDIFNIYRPDGPGTPGTPGKPGKPGANGPRTDDLSNLALWLTLMGLSLVALITLFIFAWRRKRRDERHR